MSVELEMPKQKDFRIDIFQKEFPTATIRNIEFQDLPEKAVTLFDSRLSLRTHDHAAGDYDSFFAIDHSDNKKTYVAQKNIINPNGSSIDWTYFFDTNEQGQDQGYGEMVHSETGNPFVGYTYSNVRKQGLGQRRLEMMNGLARMLYDQPLYSAFTISDQARSIWETLVAQGVAESYMDGDSQRYVFL